MHSAHFWMGDEGGGCAFYRCQLPAASLTQQGWIITAAKRLDLGMYTGQRVALARFAGNVETAARIQAEAFERDYDLMVAQRPSIPEVSYVLAAMTKPYVIETDDDLFSISPTNVGGGYHYYKRSDVLKRLAYNLRGAAAVTCTTSYLAEQLSQFNDNVIVLPNRIPNDVIADGPSEPERPCIGWAGSASHDKDLMELIEPLRAVLDATGAQWRMTCDLEYAESYIRKLGHDAVVTDWTWDTPSYIRQLNFTVGVIPLADDQFNRSKSAVKALEYASQGIPFVASGHGPYREFLGNSSAGIIATTPTEWRNAMLMILNEPSVREEMALAGLELARQHTIDEHGVEWAKAYEGLGLG